MIVGIILLASAQIGIARDATKASLAPPGAKKGQIVRRGKAGIEWMTIPGGTFMMGDYRFAHDVDAPPHKVTIRTFQMAKTLVTNKQYRACVQAGVCTATGDVERFNGDDQPVVEVTWQQARTFSKWVGGRLPSEAEWEYAARGAGKDIKYPWGNEYPACRRAVFAASNDSGPMSPPFDIGFSIDPRVTEYESKIAAHLHYCGPNATMPVCSRPAGNTAQGLCDMAGNVWEWVLDCEGPYKDAPIDGSAQADSMACSKFGALMYRIVRGGSWQDLAWNGWTSRRWLHEQSSAELNIGFRPVRSRFSPMVYDTADFTYPKLLNKEEMLQSTQRLYPEKERLACIEGLVTLSFRVNDKGQIGGISVTKSAGAAFDNPAITTIRLARFSPALGPNGPVAMVVSQTIVFQCDSKDLGVPGPTPGAHPKTPDSTKK